MDVDPSVRLTSKLQINNIMRSSDCVAELDTIHYTSGSKTSNSKGGTDYWVVKLTSNGSKVWDLLN